MALQTARRGLPAALTLLALLAGGSQPVGAAPPDDADAAPGGPGPDETASGTGSARPRSSHEVVVPDVPGAAEQLQEVFGTDAELSGFIRESLQFREAMGLASDPREVLELLGASADDPSISMGYLTPLRAEEVAKVDRQMEIQTRLSFGRPEIEARVGGRFAGLWIDHRADSLVTIALGGRGPSPSPHF